MIGWCADVIADWLIRKGAAEEEDKELYSYAAYSLLFSLSPLLLAMGFGICMGCEGRSVLIILPFAIIRKFSGGYHAKYSWLCLIESSLLILLCIGLSFWLRAGWPLACLTVGAAFSLMHFSPIDTENRTLDMEEKVHCKEMTVFWTGVFLLMELLFFIMQWKVGFACISIGILLSAGLQLPCIIKKILKN